MESLPWAHFREIRKSIIPDSMDIIRAKGAQA